MYQLYLDRSMYFARKKTDLCFLLRSFFVIVLWTTLSKTSEAKYKNYKLKSFLERNALLSLKDMVAFCYHSDDICNCSLSLKSCCVSLVNPYLLYSLRYDRRERGGRMEKWSKAILKSCHWKTDSLNIWTYLRNSCYPGTDTCTGYILPRWNAISIKNGNIYWMKYLNIKRLIFIIIKSINVFSFI